MSKPVALLIGGTERTAARLAETFEVIGMGDLKARGAQVTHALYQGHDPFGPALMDQMPGLQMIANYGVGYDAIDVPAALERGIMVSHTPGVLNDEVANTAVMLMLAGLRNLVADEQYLRAGRWETEGSAPLSQGVRGRTVGILGLGRIGKATAEKLQVFGVEVVYNGRRPQDGVPYRFCADLTEMAREVDVLICIAPGGAATRHLINAEVIEALGPEGVLVNVGRGTVVDEAALIAALKAGKLGHAALDVFEHEPKVPIELLEMPNTTLLPHVGSATVETRQAMGDLAVDNLVSHLKDGTALTAVPECQ